MSVELENYLRSIAKEVDSEMEKFFPKKITEKWLSRSLGKADFDFHILSTQKALADPIWDFLSRGGKRWRPALMLLACESVGGNKKKAMPFAVIPELVHNGTIMVDDLEDNSTLRRGRPTTHLLFGNDVAINAGNAMYYLPMVILFNSNSVSPEIKNKIYGLYSTEMLRLSFGQAMDIYWHKGGSRVNEGQYLQMCSFKTGSLARLSAQLGAVLGGASESQTKALGGFATTIGVAFQIQDDILNIKPATLEWGKEIGDDIKEGKRTLMVLHALKKLPKGKKKRLLEILDSPRKDDRSVKEAILLLEECDSITYAHGVAKNLVKKSWQKLDKSIPSSSAKSMLKAFADYLIERKI